MHFLGASAFTAFYLALCFLVGNSIFGGFIYCMCTVTPKSMFQAPFLQLCARPRFPVVQWASPCGCRTLLVQNQMSSYRFSVLVISSTVPPATQAQVPMFLFSPSLSTEIRLITKRNSIRFTFTKFSELSILSLYLYPNCDI